MSGNATRRSALQKAHLSSDMVKRMLDENQQLLLAAMENQEKGRQKECMTYLRKLHENLVMLGTVGDAQVNSNALPSQIDVSSISVATSSGGQSVNTGALNQGLMKGPPPAESTRGKRTRVDAEEASVEWTEDEEKKLYRSVTQNGDDKFGKHEHAVGTKSASQCEQKLELDTKVLAQRNEAEVTNARQLQRAGEARR